MSYQLNPSATSNMPGEIVQVKIPNDDDYIVCVGSDGVPFVSSKNAISGSSTPQTLFEQLSSDKFVKDIFYPHYQGNMDISFNIAGSYKNNVDGIGYLSKNIFTTQTSLSLTMSQFAKVISTIEEDNSYGLSVVSIIYWDGTVDNNTVRVVGGSSSYSAGASINTTAGYVVVSAVASSSSFVAKFPTTELEVGYNIIVSTISSYRVVSYPTSTIGENYISIYLNGVLKETTKASANSVLTFTTNTDSFNTSLYDDTQLLCYFRIDGRLTEAEQLAYFNQFKSDHGIA